MYTCDISGEFTAHVRGDIHIVCLFLENLTIHWLKSTSSYMYMYILNIDIEWQ